MIDFAKRRQQLASNANLGGDDPFVTCDLASVQYLTGFTGSNGTFVSQQGASFLVTDGRYRDQAKQQCPGVEIVVNRDVVGAIKAIVATHTRVALDDRTSWSLSRSLTSAGLEISAVPDPVASLRSTKDAEEIDRLRKAADITAAALRDLAATIEVDEREVDIARRLEMRFGELGAEDRAFPTIVASGPNSAIPHHRAGERRLAAGDLLVIDCGARFEGYHADMTRTFIVGAPPQPWQAEIHDLVLAAHTAAVERLTPGVVAHQVDAAARDVIAAGNHAEEFTHGTGHGVGLQIHEAPMLSATSEARVLADSVVTIEPGIYLPGKGGVRIEDTVLAASTTQVLTDMHRGLTRVG